MSQAWRDLCFATPPPIRLSKEEGGTPLPPTVHGDESPVEHGRLACFGGALSCNRDFVQSRSDMLRSGLKRSNQNSWQHRVGGCRFKTRIDWKHWQNIYIYMVQFYITDSLSTKRNSRPEITANCCAFFSFLNFFLFFFFYLPHPPKLPSVISCSFWVTFPTWSYVRCLNYLFRLRVFRCC